MDFANYGESHYDETHVDDDYKVRCAFLHPIAIDDFVEVKISNEHMHDHISHNRVDENYVDVKYDEELLTGDEWLHMMQQKVFIYIL